MLSFYGLQEVNTVILMDKKERARIANISLKTQQQALGQELVALLKLHLIMQVFLQAFKDNTTGRIYDEQKRHSMMWRKGSYWLYLSGNVIFMVHNIVHNSKTGTIY